MQDQEKTEDHDQTQFGRVTWHQSEEGSGPDVGISIGLGNGRQLWIGEIPETRYVEIAPDGKCHLGTSGGWWIALYDPKAVNVLAKCVGAEEGRDFVELLARVIAKGDGTLVDAAAKAADIKRVAEVFRNVAGRDLAEIKSSQDAGLRGLVDSPRTAALKAAVAEYDRIVAGEPAKTEEGKS